MKTQSRTSKSTGPRECGTCTLCCTVTLVPEFQKPPGKTCAMCEGGTGCLIYNRRPKSCREFTCQWLAGDMPLGMRPDMAHFALEKLPGVPVVLALLDRRWKGDWRTPAVTAALRRQYQDKGVTVVGTDGKALLTEGATSEGVQADINKAARSLGVH